MKIYNTNKKCEEEQIVSNETTLINNIGLTYPGTAMPLRPLTLNEHNSIRGINQMGLNVINPHYGYNATGCCGNDTLIIKGNLSVTGSFDFDGRGRFHDLSANWMQYYNHSSFFTWGVHIIPKSGTLFTLAMRGLHTNPHYHVHWDHQASNSDLLPPANPNWTGEIDQANSGKTDTESLVIGNDGGHTHTDNFSLTSGSQGETQTIAGDVIAVNDHSHTITPNPHEHDINSDKCNNTHDHYIRDETRVWYEGWLYPGFGGYGNSTQSLGYKAAANTNGQVAKDPTIAGTDYDPSHNLTAYGAQNGIHDDGSSPGTLFPTPSAGEYTGNLLTERPRLGGWSDRSSFPSCSFKGDSSFEYGMAIATSIPFDGWLINDADGSPFRNTTTWPHGGHTHSNLNCDGCNQSEHHEHKGPSSRFSWMLGKYDEDDYDNATPSFTLTIYFYLVRCDPEGCGVSGGIAAPLKIGTATIKKKCGSAKWGDGNVFDSVATVTIKAGDGIGMFIKSNNDGNDGEPDNSTGNLHSPATFTLEVHRKY